MMQVWHQENAPPPGGDMRACGPLSTVTGEALSSPDSGTDYVLEKIKLSGLLEWNGWERGVQRTLPVSK